jgi:hypothetical protein
LTHDIPPEQMDAAMRAKFVWISHGHPDHLSAASLSDLRGTEILLPDHVGGRIATALRRDGYRVHVLRDNEWVQLSDRVRILCKANKNQDAVLFIDVNGRLVLDFNDANVLPTASLRRMIRRYRRSFLLRLDGFGDTDMINFHDEAGNRIPPLAKAWRESGYALGSAVARSAEAFGATHVIPFSSMHRYQRTDSAWANECRAEFEDHSRGFESSRCELLPPFVRYDCVRDVWEPIEPPPVEPVLFEPGHFGDDWGEQLDREDADVAAQYFRAIEHLAVHLDFVNLRVGGRDNVIPLRGARADVGLTFEAPRTSLMKAIRWKVFDDLLIGNFMKTTLHGDWPSTGLYPDFTPYVTKYADNGAARSDAELQKYFAEYRRRMGAFEYLRSELESRAVSVFRNRISDSSFLYRPIKRAYWFVHRTSPPPTASRPLDHLSSQSKRSTPS